MMNHSQNGDGKNRAPNNRITSHQDGQRLTHPVNQHEQQIIDALTGRYDEIELLWNEAEEDLKRFRIPHPEEHCYSYEDRCDPPYCYVLGFVRYGKGWRICHGGYEDTGDPDLDHNWKPIIECPLDLRVKMIRHFAALRKKVVEAAEKAVPKLDDAISSFRKIFKS